MAPVTESWDWEVRATKGEEEERERRRKAMGGEKKDMAKQAWGVEAAISGMEAETVQVYHEAQTVLAAGTRYQSDQDVTAGRPLSPPECRFNRTSLVKRVWACLGRVGALHAAETWRRRPWRAQSEAMARRASTPPGQPAASAYTVLHYACIERHGNSARIYRRTTSTTTTVAAPHMQDRPPPLQTPGRAGPAHPSSGPGRAHRPFVWTWWALRAALCLLLTAHPTTSQSIRLHRLSSSLPGEPGVAARALGLCMHLLPLLSCVNMYVCANMHPNVNA